MFSKSVVLLAVMAVTSYCQHHHHQTIHLQTVVKHEIPKKVEYHQEEHKAAPVVHNEVHGHASSQNVHHTTHTHHEAPKHYFIPVHEPAPVHENVAIVAAPIHHVAPVHHATQVHHVTPVHHAAPVHHATQVHHVAPVYHAAPVQHVIVQAPHHEPAHHEESHHDHHEDHADVDYYAHPKYEYEYKVEDPHTGDNKYQHEIRDGDVVKGVYSLHEPDGSIRTVNYSSDKKSGFSADIVHKGHSKHEYHHHH